LESVRGIFDEIVVVDTGSTDRTREIAGEFGARVFEFAWIDDFASARNESLAHATGDYAFWLDADDVVEPPEREKLRALLDGLRSDEPAGYLVRCACDPGPDGSGGETVVDHVRLFPLRKDVRWTYRVHEQIMPALRRAGIPVRWTDLVVRHTGYVDLALRDRELDRDARILREELKARPDDPFITPARKIRMLVPASPTCVKEWPPPQCTRGRVGLGYGSRRHPPSRPMSRKTEAPWCSTDDHAGSLPEVSQHGPVERARHRFDLRLMGRDG
jgi:glycosyltransferase involved in cell wall biosynthesis